MKREEPRLPAARCIAWSNPRGKCLLVFLKIAIDIEPFTSAELHRIEGFWRRIVKRQKQIRAVVAVQVVGGRMEYLEKKCAGLFEAGSSLESVPNLVVAAELSLCNIREQLLRGDLAQSRELRLCGLLPLFPKIGLSHRVQRE